MCRRHRQISLQPSTSLSTTTDITIPRSRTRVTFFHLKKTNAVTLYWFLKYSYQFRSGATLVYARITCELPCILTAANRTIMYATKHANRVLITHTKAMYIMEIGMIC